MKIIENKLEILEIAKITISKTNPRKSINEKDLKELTDSVKQIGVLQPILVRPKGKTFELVCGERRFLASQLAGLTIIPANIRDLSDDEAFEIQIIENLERKDVHPLEEADAFKKMLDSGKYTIADIAAKMAKNEIFIAGRLKLVDLIEPIRIHFKAGFLGIGHAVLIAKCDPGKQQEIFEDAKSWNDIDEPSYGTMQNIKESIEEDALDLTDAPFDVADDLLVRGVCACVVCPKRSKANPMLFAEFQENDSCFDEKCYINKSYVHTQNKVAQIINENEAVFLVSGNQKPDDVIINICKEFNVKILKQYDDYRNYKMKGFTESKGFYVSGREIGTYQEIWIENNSKEITGTESSNTETIQNKEVAEDISKIETRSKRALELDAEKIWANILKVDNATFKNNSDQLSNVEKIALVVALHSQCYQLHNELDFIKSLSIKSIQTEAMPDQLVNLAIRSFIAHKLSDSYGSHENNERCAAYKQVLEDYYPEEIKTIVNEQSEIANKRIERATERIEALKTKLVEEAPKKTTKSL